jgi:isopenicillin-N epimerase
VTLPPFATAVPSVNDIWGEDWADVLALWALEPSVDHLNHGSFGAVPLAVLEEQQSWRTRMEENPVRFFSRELVVALEEARGDVSRFLGVEDDGLVFVRNATTGVSTVLASLDLEAGSEILVTDHSYGAVLLAVGRHARLAGATVVTAEVPLDVDDDELVARVLDAAGERTRLAVLDDITSPTARRLPLERLVPALKERGVQVLVDAAHGPGMLDIAVPAVGADYWTGNLHKWCCAPRGSGALWVAPELRGDIRPLVASWDEEAPYPVNFQRSGTDDYTAWLAVPRALRTLSHLGWDRVRAHNAELAGQAQRRLAESLGIEPPVTRPDVSMQLVPLPTGVAANLADAGALQISIAERVGVEVAITSCRGQGFVRVSAAAYNAPKDYDRLCEHLPGLL